MIDVTPRWRHLSFLMYVGALYLAALGRVTVGRIYYALYAPSQGSQFSCAGRRTRTLPAFQSSWGTQSYLSQKRKSLRKLLRDEHQLPLSAKVAEQLEGLLVPYRVASKKKDLALTEDELERQARLVDDLLERGNLPAALGLMKMDGFVGIGQGGYDRELARLPQQSAKGRWKVDRAQGVRLQSRI